ncbi:hypothetical protein HYH02_007308 [Chlamydomonas schloesseri]|uniref:EamA domain-containing protein n=1 Tax=Chlamydomonas schloesseri TaxID=2026947 RepID=A0A835WHX4_9CHLO|nr:hypothetical protein HYH02_007308 [Chlamydomonas schloesseri]|eukprot:KAG2447852.1 hypothetical protein HYH02_007308 [Chlamydomonas schloesseri]
MAVGLLKGQQPPLVLTWWHNLVIGTLTALPLAFSVPFPPVAPSGGAWLLVGGIAAMQLVAQFMMSRGFQLESAGRGAAINVLQVLFSFVLDVAVLHTHPSPLSVLGSGLVASGVLRSREKEEEKKVEEKKEEEKKEEAKKKRKGRGQWLDPPLYTALSVVASLGVSVDDVALLGGLRPPQFSVERAGSPDGDAGGETLAPIRVWPGLGGLELFRLQLRALLGADASAPLAAEDIITFVVRVPGKGNYEMSGADALAAAAPSTAASAPGSGVEGVAPHAAVPVAAAPPVTLAGVGMANDDWIDLLCSVADMLDGGADVLSSGRNNHAAAAAAAAAAAVAATVAGAEGEAARGCTVGSSDNDTRPRSLEDLVGYFETGGGNASHQQRQEQEQEEHVRRRRHERTGAHSGGAASAVMHGMQLPPGIHMNEEEDVEVAEELVEGGVWEAPHSRRQQQTDPEPAPTVTVTAVIRRAAPPPHAGAAAPAYPAAAFVAAAASSKPAPMVHNTARRHATAAATAASSLAASAGGASTVLARSVAAPVLSRLAWRGRRSSITTLPRSLAQGRSSCTDLGQQQQPSSVRAPGAATPGGATICGSSSYNALVHCSGNSNRRRSQLNPQNARRLSILGMRALLATRGNGCYSTFSGCCSASGGVCTAGGNAAATGPQLSPGYIGVCDAAGVSDVEYMLLQQLQRWDSLSCGGEWLDEYIYEDGDPCSPAFSIPLPVPPLHQAAREAGSCTHPHALAAAAVMTPAHHLPHSQAQGGVPTHPSAQHPHHHNQDDYEDELREQLESLRVTVSPHARPVTTTTAAAAAPAGLPRLTGAGYIGHMVGLGHGHVSCVVPAMAVDTVATKVVPLTADEQLTMRAPAPPLQRVLGAPNLDGRGHGHGGGAGAAHVHPQTHPLPNPAAATGTTGCRCGRGCGAGACCFASCVDSSRRPMGESTAPPPQLQGPARSLPPARALAATVPPATWSTPLPSLPQVLSAPGTLHMPASAAAAAAASSAAATGMAPDLVWPPPAFRALRIKAVRGESGRRASHLESLSMAAHQHYDYGIGVSHGDGTSGYSRLCRNVSTAPAWWAHGLRRSEQVGVFG